MRPKALEVAYLIAKYCIDNGTDTFTYRQLFRYARQKRPSLHPNTIEREVRRLAGDGYLERTYIYSRLYRRRIARFKATEKLFDLLRLYGVRI